MNSNAGRIAKKLARRKRRIENRLQAARDSRFVRMASGAPAVLSTTGLKYELAEKSQAIVYGGVPLMLRVARESGLIGAIDSGVPILKWRCPYDELDQVLNLAMNARCEGTCLVVIRKNSSHEKGEKVLFDEIRDFFDITNDREATAAEIVFGGNDRCDQENLIANIAGDARALTAPVDSLVGAAAADHAASPRDSRSGTHDSAAHGIQNVRERSPEGSLPDRAPRPPSDPPRAALEPATPHLLPLGHLTELLKLAEASRELACPKSRVPVQTPRPARGPPHRF